MRQRIRAWLAVLHLDPQADRVVPPSGASAHVTIMVCAVMAFLAVFALALVMALATLALRWDAELTQSATLRIIAPEAEKAERTADALRVLETTEGVAMARALSAEEQAALLEPWFGADLGFDDLPFPQLIEVVAEDPGYDAQALQLRLAAEVPGAQLDDHSHWRAPLVEAAARLRWAAWGAVVLMGAALAGMITLAANAALASNAQAIAVLRLVGATDSFVSQVFVRRLTLRALTGACVGTGLGIAALLVLPAPSQSVGFLSDLGLRSFQWGALILIPPVCAAIAFWASARAARYRLEALT